MNAKISVVFILVVAHDTTFVDNLMYACIQSLAAHVSIARANIRPIIFGVMYKCPRAI